MALHWIALCSCDDSCHDVAFSFHTLTVKRLRRSLDTGQPSYTDAWLVSNLIWGLGAYNAGQSSIFCRGLISQTTWKHLFGEAADSCTKVTVQAHSPSWAACGGGTCQAVRCNWMFTCSCFYYVSQKMFTAPVKHFPTQLINTEHHWHIFCCHASSMAPGLAMSVCWSVHHFGPDWNISAAVGWITMKFYTDIHGSRWMNPTDFADPLTFPFAPPWGWHQGVLSEIFWLLCILFTHSWLL